MPNTNCFAQVRGSVIRATRTDASGAPLPGESAVVVSKRVSSVTIDEVSEDGENIRERNFGGELCVVDDAPAEVLGYTGVINLCGVDPDMISLFTKQPVVKDSAGNVIGFDANTGIDLDSFGFALEIWTKIAGGGVDGGGHRAWGYTPFPFFKGGRLGGFSFENGLVQFTIQGAQTRDNNNWGTGPFDVMRAATTPFAPTRLHTPLAANTHYRNIITYLAPPAPSCGAVALPAA